MPIRTIALFAAAVLPLVITPGPDMLFVLSQGMSGGRAAALKANIGVLLGYSAHALLVLCGTVYAIAGLLVASAVRRAAFKVRGRQYIEGAAGGLLMVSAVRVAVG